MFKLVVLFALVAIAAARPGLLVESPIAYSTSVDSGYAYSHSVHTPDYVNSVSVSKPLSTTTIVRSVPVVHAKAAYVAPAFHTYATVPAVHTYAAAPVYHAW